MTLNLNTGTISKFVVSPDFTDFLLQNPSNRHHLQGAGHIVAAHYWGLTPCLQWHSRFLSAIAVTKVQEKPSQRCVTYTGVGKM